MYDMYESPTGLWSIEISYRMDYGRPYHVNTIGGRLFTSRKAAERCLEECRYMYHSERNAPTYKILPVIKREKDTYITKEWGS